jgi:copper(I)-binding protein
MQLRRIRTESTNSKYNNGGMPTIGVGSATLGKRVASNSSLTRNWVRQAVLQLARPHAVSTIFSLIVFASGVCIGSAFAADSLQLRISKARLPAVEQVGGDVPLLMAITNDGAEADALLRVNCPFATFAEKHTVDRGEGSPAMRAIKSIPIPANQTTELKADGYHVMLLQTRQKLVAGEALHCSIAFQKAGLLGTEVQVHHSP